MLLLIINEVYAAYNMQQVATNRIIRHNVYHIINNCRVGILYNYKNGYFYTLVSVTSDLYMCQRYVTFLLLLTPVFWTALSYNVPVGAHNLWVKKCIAYMGSIPFSICAAWNRRAILLEGPTVVAHAIFLLFHGLI